MDADAPPEVSHGSALLTAIDKPALCTCTAASPAIRPLPMAPLSPLVTLSSLPARALACSLACTTGSSKADALDVPFRPVSASSRSRRRAVATAFLACVSPCDSIEPIADAILPDVPSASPPSPCAPATIVDSTSAPLSRAPPSQSPLTRLSTAPTAWPMASASEAAAPAESLITSMMEPRSFAWRAASSATAVAFKVALTVE